MATDTIVEGDAGTKTSRPQCGGNPAAGAEIGAGAAHRAPVLEINEKPAPGHVIVLEASSQEIIRIPFDIEGAAIREANGNLYIDFRDGGVIVINGATITQLCSSPDAALEPSDDSASVPHPENPQLVDLTGSGFRQLIADPIGEASLTRTGPLGDVELDRVRFPGYEKAGATPDFQGNHDDVRGNSSDSRGNPDDGNHPPVAAGDSLSGSEDGTVIIPVTVLLANDLDSDGDALAILSVQGAINGTVQLSGGNVIFTPAPDYHGLASFSYTVSDAHGATATASVGIAISAVNDPPAGADRTVTTAEDTPFSLTAADLGFSDPNDGPADSLLAVTITSLPNNGTLLLNGVTVSAGQSIGVADIGAGALVFQPVPNASGAAYSRLTFQVQDTGGTANGGQDIDPIPNTMTIDVIPVNDPPVAGDDAFSTDEDVALSGSVLGNDSDVEGPLSVSLAAGPANGGLALNLDGTFTYTPAADFNGADGLSYIVTDSDGAIASAIVTIDVIPVNDPPIVGNEIWAVSTASAMAVDMSTLLANDADPEGSPLAVTGVGNASNGTVGLAGPTVTYTAGAAGPASFEYTVADSGGANSTGIVSITNVQVTNGADTVDISGLGASLSLIDGRNGNDTITGGAGVDSLIGGAGNDTLDGGAGADALTGGAGNDTFVVDDAGDTVLEAAGSGTDLIQSSLTWTLGANLENLTLIGSGAIDGTGNTLANVITGNGADNRLNGGSGNDTLNGGAGSDILDGGTGNDRLLGGTGDDVYVVDSTSDVVTENAGEGTDIVYSSVTRTLGSDVENLTLTGGANINGTGNALDNVLVGNIADNTLTGGAGADTMEGGAGNDTYVVDDAGDIILEAAGEGTDLVQSSVTVALSANAENLTLTGSAAIDGAGNDLDNVVLGNTGANTLDGGLGNDTLSGGNGDDVILGGLGDDLIDATGGGGNDAITGGAGADTISVGSGNDRLLYLSTGDVLDTIIGFDKNATGGQDFVDLDALFDSLGVAAVDRAGRVQFVDTGPDVQIQIDADGGAGNGFELVMLTFQGMANLTGLTAGAAGTDDIQVGS